MSRPEVSIVVPAYNQSQLLLRLLESFERIESAERYEVIVVDDCSPDDTEEVVKRWQGKLLPFPTQYIRVERNQGPGHARNVGARAAVAPVVAFTDTDCIVEPQWIRALLSKLDPDNMICGVGGRIKPYKLDYATARYYGFHNVLEPPKQPLNYLVTCNCIYLREPLLEVGGFSEDIPRPGGEDVEASILLWRRGWRFAFAPDALVYHDFRPGLRAFWRTWYNYGWGSGIVMHRQLLPQEIYPEWGGIDVDNYWNGHFLRPNVTGLRSFLKAFVWHFGECRRAKLPFGETCNILALWMLDRVAYIRGWRYGRSQYFHEYGRDPKYFDQPDRMKSESYRREHGFD